MVDKSDISRREFLASTGNFIKSTAALQAISAVAMSVAASGCGSSSAASQSQNPSTNPPPPNNSPRPIDWPENIGNGKSVVILGAGIAGLVSAFEMSKLGYQCIILEATDRVGGRVRTIRNGDVVDEVDSSQVCLFESQEQLYFNAGAARIPHHHELILGYCREFGISLETFVNENTAARLQSESAFQGQPLLARQLKSDTHGFIGELLATSVNQGDLDNSLSAAEKSNLLGLLQQFAGLDANYNYQGSSRAGFPQQEAIGSRARSVSTLEPLARESILSSEFWQFKLDFFRQINQQATMLQPVGGMDKIPQAFELQVRDLITYNAEVQAIRKTNTGVQIIYRDSQDNQNEQLADFCICTIPAPVLATIDNDFSGAHQNEIQNFSYSQSGKIAFQSSRFWESRHNIYGGISWTDQNITQLWYPSNQLGAEQGIIVGGYTFGQNQGGWLADLSPSARLTESIQQASRIHVDYADFVSQGVSISWPKVPYQLGAWGTSQPQHLLVGDDNVFFAGEHLSILQGWQEGAVLSAYSAIDQIVNLS